MKAVIATLGLVGLLAQTAQAMQTLRVHVEGVRNDRGQVTVELCLQG